MKPIVLKENANGKIEMTIEEIQHMVEDAYHEGYEDGRKTQYIYYPITTTPAIIPQVTWDYPTITC